MPPDYLDVGIGLVPIVTSLQILSVGIDHSGSFVCWQSSSESVGLVVGVLSRLGCLGFATCPATMAAAL